jgi:hypothetical protein
MAQDEGSAGGTVAGSRAWHAIGCSEPGGVEKEPACWAARPEEGCSCIRRENSAAVRQATGDPDTTAGQAAAAHGSDVTQICAGSGPWVACACDVCDAGSAMQEGARPPLTQRSPRLLPRNANPGVEQRTATVSIEHGRRRWCDAAAGATTLSQPRPRTA